MINSSTDIRNNILPLLAQYPPLTTRIHLQLAFVVRAMAGISIQEYIAIRAAKYDTQLSITPLFNEVPAYFPS